MTVMQNPTKLYYTNSKMGYTNSKFYYTNSSLHLLMQRPPCSYSIIFTFSLFHIYGCLHFFHIKQSITYTLAQQIYIGKCMNDGDFRASFFADGVLILK